jgi:hypothetical protein
MLFDLSVPAPPSNLIQNEKCQIQRVSQVLSVVHVKRLNEHRSFD